MSASIVWFRQDLRLTDNGAFQRASALELGVVPVYIWSPEEEGSWAPGGASLWWLHHSLTALATDLKKLGLDLVVRKGTVSEQLALLVQETDAKYLLFNRRYEPSALEQERSVKTKMQALGVGVESFNSSLLFEPGEIANQQGNPFKVFTPFWKSCLHTKLVELPKIAKPRVKSVTKRIFSLGPELEIARLALLPKLIWANGFSASWTPGERAAQAELKRFTKSILQGYSETRNLPSLAGTSRLSAHLHFGEIGPRQIWEAVVGSPMTPTAQSRLGMASYPKEIGWREFAFHLLYHFPQTPTKPLRPEFGKFPWKKRATLLRAWEKGVTGFPLIDAGMRELWATGWMHNRVRMIVASFLVKHLLISWQQGSRWFWDTLVDADLANNTLGWQWAAGCGADAAPYFRIFNPVLQGEKFDADGVYVRRWIPELKKVPNRWIHQPWAAPGGSPYVPPIIDLAAGRDEALAAYQQMRAEKGTNR